MVISIFILIYFSLKLVLAKNNNQTNYLSSFGDEEMDPSRLYICLSNLVTTAMGGGESSREEKNENIECVLRITQKYPTFAKPIIQNIINMIRPFIPKITEKIEMPFLKELLMEILDESHPFFNDLFKVIETNESFIENILIFVKQDSTREYSTENEFFKILYRILNIDGMDQALSHIINSTHNDVIFKLFETRYLNESIYSTFYQYLSDIFKTYKDDLIHLMYNIIKYYENKDRLIDVIKDFFVKGLESNFTRDLRNTLRQEHVRKEFSDKIKINDDIGDIIKEELLRSGELVDGFFDLLTNETIIDIISKIIAFKENATYIEEKVPSMISEIHHINKTYIQFLFGVSETILKRMVNEESINRFVTEELTEKVDKQYFGAELKKFNISPACATSMRQIYFEKLVKLNITESQAVDSMTKLRFFFIKKAILDSTKVKNDFLTYENCLEKKFNETLLNNLNFNFTLQPIYILAMFDDSRDKKKLSDTILTEQYDFWLGYCLPYVLSNDSNTTREICTQEDYSNILKVFLDLPYNMENSEVHSFKIFDKNFSKTEKAFCYLNLIIILIPIIIQIFLFIYYTISYHRYKRFKLLNQLTINQEQEMEKRKNLKRNKKGNYDEDEEIITPKWYKFLNEYFNIFRNGTELFISHSKESNINNINGITYIKGLLGVSMILYIFGHLFLILFNLPFKNFTLSDFNSSTRNPFYVIPLIGLRYSPRVILSCSGYTLIYKFLNFIVEQPRNYLLKFILRQSYKYLLLIIVVFYMRYSIYYLTIIQTETKRPMMEILKYNLETNNQDYFLNFFDCLLGYFGDISFKKKQSIIQYFYVPLNEIFLFMFGVIFISIGYKYKLRNDIIIMFIILLIFVTKIFIYIFYIIGHNKYSTLFYNVYDYGAMMLNPIYNLPSYLIGMFFGLINYSIQKGINLYGVDAYQKIFSINDESLNIIPEKSKESEIDNRQTILDTQITMKNSNKLFGGDLNKYDGPKKEESDENLRSYTLMFQRNTILANKITSYNKSQEKNIEFESDFNQGGQSNDINSDYNEKIREMPFLIWPIKFLNFHNQNEGRFYFKLIIGLFIFLISAFSTAQFFYVGFLASIDKEKDKIYDITEKLSFKEIITSPSLNFIYTIDVDLVISMVNWGFFILYSSGSKTADIYDFFNNNFWTFFLKCYYTFIVFSTPIIISIIYQSETVINFGLLNVILFSFISLILIFLAVILFYSMYEIPLKKIFKSFLVKEDILSDKMESDNYEIFDLSDRLSKT